MSDEKKTDVRELSPGAASAVRDARPRYRDVDIAELGGTVRIRRLEPEQVVAARKRLGDIPKPLRVTAENRFALRKLLHASLVPADSKHLLLPGDEGFLRIEALPDDTLTRVAGDIIDHNGL